MRRASLALLSFLFLYGCQRSAPTQEAQEAPVAISALERAALETGIIPDASKMSPIGLYRRGHEAGRDSLCIVPGSEKRYRFALEAIFGTEQYCRGGGTARRVGDKLILHFSGRSRCLVVARYEGDRIALPGVLDMKCADLCSGRGSLEGVTFPRLSSDKSAALAERGRDGESLCEP